MMLMWCSSVGATSQHRSCSLEQLQCVKLAEREGTKLKLKLILLCVSMGIFSSMSWGLIPGSQHHLHPGRQQGFVGY